MKGIALDQMIFTFVLVVVASFTVLIAFILVGVLFFKSSIPFVGGGQITHEFELIGIFNKPFSLAEAVTSFKPNDRSFLENALEASIVGSLRRTDSQNIQAPMKTFLEFFELKSYQLAIKKGQLALFTVNNFIAPCGEGKGVCTTPVGARGNFCGEGRQQLSDNSCFFSQICCSIEIKNAKRCGGNLEGVCTSVALDCGEGRETINDAGLCSSGQVCCKYVDISTGFASKAEIPLIYKGEKIGEINVETG